MLRVNREQLLNSLESVSAGLAAKATVEQSSMFCFKDERVWTYNDEICASAVSPLEGLAGVIKADKLIDILRKLQEDELDVDVEDNKLIILGMRKDVELVLQKDIQLPIDKLDSPNEWNPLPGDFSEALTMVSQCCSRDKSLFMLTCINITDKWLESCDNTQVIRYKMKLKLPTSALVRGESVKHVVQLDVTEFSETGAWLHFRNPAGVVIACRKFVFDYKDLSGPLTVDGGTRAILPKGLVEAADRAEVFSSDGNDSNKILVELKPGKLLVRGQGASGQYRESKKVEYKGEPLSFRVAPKLLKEICTKHNECELTKNRLKVKGEKFTYVVCLSAAEPDKPKVEE